MGTLDEHPATKIVKLLYLGDSGAGKTGSLESLVAADYKLRILDFDNLLGSLFAQVMKKCPDKAKTVVYETLTDQIRVSQGVTTIVPAAYQNAMRLLDNWKTPQYDLGKPESWGEDTILCIDTLTTCARSAYNYAKAMNSTNKDGRAAYYTAQEMVVNLLSLLHAKDFNVNVIVLAHIDYDKNHLDLTKGFPRSIGSALNTQIGTFFNAVLLAESQGSGTSVKRVIRTNSTGVIDLKNPIPFKLTTDTLPLETGLADFFKAIRQ